MFIELPCIKTNRVKGIPTIPESIVLASKRTLYRDALCFIQILPKVVLALIYTT